MKKVDPLRARMQFQFKELRTWGITLAVFIPVAFVLIYLLGGLVGGLFAMIGAVCLFFYLDLTAIGFNCRHCGGTISINTPWICGNKDSPHRNDDVGNFPFVHQCKQCGYQPKAYECHHCQKLVFLTEDEQKAGYARCADLRTEASPPRADPEVDEILKLEREIQIKERAVKKAELEVQLKARTDRLNPTIPRRKTPDEELQEFLANATGDEDAARSWKDRIDREWPDNKFERDKRHSLIDKWVRQRLH